MTEDLGLPDLLELLSTAVGADGAMVSVGGQDEVPTVIAAMPTSLAGRRLPLSDALTGICGKGLQPTDELLLPAAMTGWLGFRPGFVAGSDFKLHLGVGCVFFWWRDRPAESVVLDHYMAKAAKIVGSYAARQAAANELQSMQDRFDVLLQNVSLGIVFVDFLRGSLVNAVAAKILDLSPSTGDAGTVVAAMKKMKTSCQIEPAEDHAPVPGADAASAEYWVAEERGIALRVESHSVGSAESPGRFWVFTDVKPLWSSTEKTKSANSVLARNLALLSEEMERRIEAEEQLRKYSSGLRQQNEELEIAKLQSDLLANQDALTGLGNRRRFRHGLEDMLASARARHTCVVVLYLDLDKFKPVNDTFGHERGDQLLRAVADTLVKTMRKDDLIARLGGDEFACALALPSGTTTDTISDLLEDLRDRLHFPVEGGERTIYVSATIGVALYPDDAADVAGLLRAADNAMYMGKSQGGNGVMAFAKNEASR
jgi:diguanylate cyclase (GGDEF)-like protein